VLVGVWSLSAAIYGDAPARQLRLPVSGSGVAGLPETTNGRTHMYGQLIGTPTGAMWRRTKAWMVFTAAAVAAVVAAVGLVAPSPAAAASGGGCSQSYVGMYGFTANSCISDNGLTLYATANGRGTNTAGSCSVHIDILNNVGTSIASSGTQGCSDGNHNGASVFELSGQYRAETCVTTYNPYSNSCVVSLVINQ
jgi:hypothetical protein